MGSFKVTLFFDRDGTLAAVHEHVMATTTVTSAYGQTVDRWVQNNRFDPDDLTVAITGNPWNAHGGAGGVLINDSGRLVIDVTTDEAIVVNGPHQAWFGDFGGACSVLAP